MMPISNFNDEAQSVGNENNCMADFGVVAYLSPMKCQMDFLCFCLYPYVGIVAEIILAIVFTQVVGLDVLLKSYPRLVVVERFFCSSDKLDVAV